jgi:hypothetical protein
MNQPYPLSNPPVRITATKKFKRGLDLSLNPEEYRALLLVLAHDTRCGKPVGAGFGVGGLRGLDFAGSIIYYNLSSDCMRIHLLSIEKVEWDERVPVVNEKSLLRVALSAATGSAVAVTVRSGLKWIWNLIDF